MNPSQPGPNTPPPQPNADYGAETESQNLVYIFVEAVGDTTIRPMRSPKLMQIRPDQPPEPPTAKS